MTRLASSLLMVAMFVAGPSALVWPCSCGNEVLTLENLSKLADAVVVAEVVKVVGADGTDQRPYLEIKVVRRLKGLDQGLTMRVWGGLGGECVSGLDGFDPGTT